MTKTESKTPMCELCGEPMPPGEEMFKFHGYSGDCPKPPLPRPPTEAEQLRAENTALRERLEKAEWREFQNPDTQVMFRAGLLACREYMARFIEVQDPVMAQSIRANWWPSLGDDPGTPRQLEWGEVANGDEPGYIEAKQISPSLEALPVALQFLLAATDKARGGK